MLLKKRIPSMKKAMEVL